MAPASIKEHLGINCTSTHWKSKFILRMRHLSYKHHSHKHKLLLTICYPSCSERIIKIIVPWSALSEHRTRELSAVILHSAQLPLPFLQIRHTSSSHTPHMLCLCLFLCPALQRCAVGGIIVTPPRCSCSLSQKKKGMFPAFRAMQSLNSRGLGLYAPARKKNTFFQT